MIQLDTPEAGVGEFGEFAPGDRRPLTVGRRVGEHRHAAGCAHHADRVDRFDGVSAEVVRRGVVQRRVEGLAPIGVVAGGDERVRDVRAADGAGVFGADHGLPGDPIVGGQPPHHLARAGEARFAHFGERVEELTGRGVDAVAEHVA